MQIVKSDKIRQQSAFQQQSTRFGKVEVEGIGRKSYKCVTEFVIPPPYDMAAFAI